MIQIREFIIILKISLAVKAIKQLKLKFQSI